MNSQSKLIKIIASVAVLAVAGGAAAYSLNSERAQVAENNIPSVSDTSTDEGTSTITVAPDTSTTTVVPVKNPTPTPSPTPTPTPTPTPVPTPTPTPTPAPTYAYKNGTFSTTITYNSPGGKDEPGVSLTIKNDIVVDSSLAPGNNDSTSDNYIQRFESDYKTMVVGKSIADLKLSKVSGASLTTRGFNDAVVKIRAQAKA